MKWRVIGLQINDAYTNMAIDEAILNQVSIYDSPNTIRMYRWCPSAVSIGYFQSIQEEVDLEYCAKKGVDVVRRITGGGAVYHDFNGEVTYSLILSEKDGVAPKDLLESYTVLCGGIVKGLQYLGLDAEFKPVNDIIVNGRKISGNAQTRRQGVILQHGTVLVDLDLTTMFKVLKVGEEKISDKMIKAVEERVTSIKREKGALPRFEDVAQSLRKGFEEAFNIETFDGDLSEKEKALAIEFRRAKYGTREWNYKR
ncbi:MAG: biotin/lipoate A/B protein ligase family protein [Candidatus Bathyarchaeia archaeon]